VGVREPQSERARVVALISALVVVAGLLTWAITGPANRAHRRATDDTGRATAVSGVRANRVVLSRQSFREGCVSIDPSPASVRPRMSAVSAVAATEGASPGFRAGPSAAPTAAFGLVTVCDYQQVGSDGSLRLINARPAWVVHYEGVVVGGPCGPAGRACARASQEAVIIIDDATGAPLGFWGY
jgi:hypothetical protein